jgi:hypothetical protein
MLLTHENGDPITCVCPEFRMPTPKEECRTLVPFPPAATINTVHKICNCIGIFSNLVIVLPSGIPIEAMSISQIVESFKSQMSLPIPNKATPQCLIDPAHFFLIKDLEPETKSIGPLNFEICDKLLNCVNIEFVFNES